MTFRDLIGQGKIVDRLRAGSRAGGRVSNAYIFCGPTGIGRTSLALAYAACLNCRSSGPETDKPCGTCSSCRKAAAGDHPDILVVAPEGGNIKVDVIREMIRGCQYQPFEGFWKVCIIDDADRMREGTANALLKILEDAPARTVFLLITERLSALLPTIVSRCQVMEMQPPSAEELSSGLQRLFDISRERADEAVDVSGGRPAIAVGIIRGTWEPQPEKIWDELMACLSSSDPLCALRAAELIQEHAGPVRENEGNPSQSVYRVIEEICARLVFAAADDGGRNITPALLRRMDKARLALESNANLQLTLENFALESIIDEMQGAV